MNWTKIWDDLKPHLMILVIFIGVSMAFFYPILQGKTLPQNDVRQWKGSFEETRIYNDTAHVRTLWTNSMFGGMPTYQISPYSPNSLFGLKIIYGLLVSGYTLPVPINAMLLYCIGFYLLLLSFRINPWLCMVGAFAYAFSTFNIVILEAGHMLQAYALGTAPLVLAALVFTYREKKYFLGGALLGLALAIHLRTNHPQMSYYAGLIVGIFIVVEFINAIMKKELSSFAKATAFVALGAIAALGTQATFMLTNSEYAADTIRGQSELVKHKDPAKQVSTGLDEDYAMAWSYGVGETFTLLIPDFRGGASPSQDAKGTVHGFLAENAESTIKKMPDQNTAQLVSNIPAYWGDQPFTSGPVYFGAIICFLFVLGLLMFKGHEKWWLLIAAILSIVLSWGRNFALVSDFFFYHVPLYNKFRSVSFTLTIASMVIPILAILILDKIFKSQPDWNDKKIRQKFITALALTGGLCLLFALIPSLAGDFQSPNGKDDKSVQDVLAQSGANAAQIKSFMGSQIGAVRDGIADARAAILRSDAIRSLIFILLAAGVLFGYMKKKIKPEYVIIGVALLSFIDLFTVNRRFVHKDIFVPKQTGGGDIIPTDANDYILADKDPDFRVLDITGGSGPFNDATASFFHKNIGGYSGTKFRRFQDLRDYYIDNSIGVIGQNLRNIPGDQLLTMMNQRGDLSTLNMLNAKYIIAGDNRKQVIQNPYRLGNAWFVKAIKPVPNADEEIDALKHFNPRDTAVVDQKFLATIGGNSFVPATDSSAGIILKTYRPNILTYESNNIGDGLAVFSEIYYSKGWHATIDGKPAEHIRADYILRAMKIPAGKHQIVFEFMPESFVKGENIALASSLALTLGLIGSIFYEGYLRRRKEVSEK